MLAPRRYPRFSAERKGNEREEREREREREKKR